MMQSLRYIVLVVVLGAAALAFIVLYNLTNINITEREREIATIKVLGFYDGETNRYVFRENIILTATGRRFWGFRWERCCMRMSWGRSRSISCASTCALRR